MEEISKPASSLEMQIFHWHFSENASFVVQSVVNTKPPQFGGDDVSDVFFHSFKVNLLIYNLRLASAIPGLDPRHSCSFTSHSSKL